MGHFETFSEFLQMGKHGLYVWLSYGISFFVIIYNILTAYLDKRQFFNEAKRRLKREQRST